MIFSHLHYLNIRLLILSYFSNAVLGNEDWSLKRLLMRSKHFHSFALNIQIRHCLSPTKNFAKRWFPKRQSLVEFSHSQFSRRPEVLSGNQTCGGKDGSVWTELRNTAQRILLIKTMPLLLPVLRFVNIQKLSINQ